MKELELTSPVRVILSQWKANGWIKVTSKYNYEKLL